MKKGKSQAAKAERMAEIDRVIERHKWHQGKLELIRRSLENGAVDTEQVNEMEENIRYYVSDNMNEDFMEDEGIYDELDLEDEEGTYGMALENEKGSSQDAQSVQDDISPEPEVVSKPARKVQKEVDPAGRKASSQTKSPLPALATLHTPLSSTNNGSTGSSSMKPAAAPARPAGEGLKYASAAAAAAASDRGNVGIAPLPPPPGSNVGISPLPPVQSRSSATSSPAIAPAFPAASSESRTPAPPAEAEIPITTRAAKKKAIGKQPTAPEPAESSTGQLRVQYCQLYS
jgi:CCR4-NOT transcription complex subunit 3